MSDRDALLSAICAEPDEDTPRLAYADWLEENEQAAHAAFIRAQIELARTPAWEPFAVLCRWRRPDWNTGEPFRSTLPPMDGSQLEWHPEAFRRGLGWRLNVKSLVAWEQLSPALLGRAPIGELHLWGATLDDWRQFATSPIVPHLRKVHFVASPIEPLLVLRNAPAALGISDIHFQRASGAGMPIVIEELLQSPLGKALRGLHFRIGFESLDDLIDALNSNDAMPLQRLTLSTMGVLAEHARRVCEGPAGRHLNELDLRDNPLATSGIGNAPLALPPGIHTLGLAATTATGAALEAFIGWPGVASLRRLDLGRNPFTLRDARLLSRSHHLAGLRSLNLSRCRIGERELFHLTRAEFWPNLTELDLRANPISPAGVRHLLDAPVPSDLTALVLDGNQLGEESHKVLRKKFGEAAVFAVSELE